MPTEPYSELAKTFDSVAEQYERARPGYPPQLFDDLRSAMPSDGTARALEIGAGTGQATRGLLEHGWTVVALEPGRELAEVARRVLAGAGDVEVLAETFEGWRADASFDLVLAATSWHWLDTAVAYRKAADVLSPGGKLAIVATEHVLPDGGDRFFVEVEESYDAVGMGDGKGGPRRPEDILAPDVDAIGASGRFGPVDIHRYVWSLDYSAEAYLALLSTYSNHIAAPSHVRERLFADIRRRIESRRRASIRKHYLTMLQLAPVLG